MNDIALSVLVTLLITFILAFIRVFTDSKVNSLKYFIVPQFLLYLIIMDLGNIVSTLIASGVIDNLLSDSGKTAKQIVQGPHWIWYSFLGVFGFEGLIKRVNITLYDKGVLTINEWITDAKNTAISAVLKKKAEMDIGSVHDNALQFYKKYETDSSFILTIALTKLGKDKYANFHNEAKQRPEINEALYFCFVLATEFPEEIKALTKG